ncbi:ferredoxin [Candidatus Peregrinibacteria bacterium HGW-Peregrinibacteria-1]|jgi:ferredoxin|nr:MAG: ferredoxin [Candidatus Peregrinibacteria bacterium HGW-Peregrinibacteria-1]
MKKHIVVHKRDKCIGCNACVTIAPQNWTMDKEDGQAKLLFAKKKNDIYIGEIFDEDYDANMEASQACPMRIIKIEKR